MRLCPMCAPNITTIIRMHTVQSEMCPRLSPLMTYSVCMRVVCECYNALDAPASAGRAEDALLGLVRGSGVLHCVVA